ncbi:pentapeptide repeat-containing protein [Almyronema epifaneia]|uniref:Pentapeptide repeat-containing protein n=1 Tax=Almyronema epifaneia S1 TaxID=2991925 RepID=A0ABW6IFK6_9CYAN
MQYEYLAADLRYFCDLRAGALGRGGLAMALAGLLWLVVGIGWVAPVVAAEITPPRQPLTLEILEQRLATPSRQEGKAVIDLRRFEIDLRPENEAFRSRFYRLLQTRLQAGSTPLGLDLSNALIQGDFDLTQLGLRAPLYGEALAPLLTAAEQEQLARDRRRLSQLSQLSQSLLIQAQPTPLRLFLFRGSLRLTQTQFKGRVNGANLFFLDRLEARGAVFNQEVNWTGARFSQTVNFIAAIFGQSARFRNSLFFGRVRFNQSQFWGPVSFQGSEFQANANFNQALFQADSNFSRLQWQQNVDFAQASWQATANFSRSRFLQALFLTETRFESLALFQQAQFHQPINLRGAAIADQLDFGDARFLPGAYINVTGLEFSADQAQILGSPGQIGRFISVPMLPGNETLLRNLVRNFRRLEQIADANQIEYTTEVLRLRELQKRLTGINLNTASPQQLGRVGFTQTQQQAILQARAAQPFLSPTDLLNLDAIDLAAYVKVRDRIMTTTALSWLTRLQAAGQWLLLSLLLLLSRYGTSSGLTLGIAIVAIAFFSLLFWLIDRYRRWQPTPIAAPPWEVGWMLSTFSGLMLGGTSLIERTAEQAGWTLLCLGVLIAPLPLTLVFILYGQGRYHKLMDSSYLVEDGSMRQLRLLIARLPVIPKFPFFRDRYTPILLDRRWNWLNYYDFSLNNWLKFGFNDIRLRDEHLPGLIAALVWYQWSLGILYIALLLWTFSRTIPGLNLLLYF